MHQEKTCIRIQSFSGSSFQKRRLTVASAQDFRYGMTKSFVHTLLLRPGKAPTTLRHFYLFKGPLYLASSLKHLCPRDPCWEEQKELARLKGSNLQAQKGEKCTFPHPPPFSICTLSHRRILMRCSGFIWATELGLVSEGGETCTCSGH